MAFRHLGPFSAQQLLCALVDAAVATGPLAHRPETAPVQRMASGGERCRAVGARDALGAGARWAVRTAARAVGSALGVCGAEFAEEFAERRDLRLEAAADERAPVVVMAVAAVRLVAAACERGHRERG